MPHWLIWICCAAVLLIAGFVATARSRRATHHDRLAAEMAAARRAIDLAEASRDAVGTGPTPDAAAAAATDAPPPGTPQLALDEAVGLLADAPDVATARRARVLAEQADALWRGRSPHGQHR